MSKDEIRKLLGGYATNTLTEMERDALFAAALEDQELFDALQDEEALKDLLSNRAVRADVRQALERPSDSRGMSRIWWAWGGAIGAVTAAVVLFIVFRPQQQETIAPPVQIASAERSPTPQVPAVPAEPHLREKLFQAAERSDRPAKRPADTIAPRESSFKESVPEKKSAARSVAAPSPPSPAIAAAPPPPVIPSPVQAEALQKTLQTQDAQAAGQSPPLRDQRLAQQPAGGLTAGRFSATTTGAIGGLSPLRYTLLKREGAANSFVPVAESNLKPGDAVRIQVFTTTAGRLTLSRRTDSGDWQRIAEVTAAGNSVQNLPEAPIEVTAAPQGFQLLLNPVASQAKAAANEAQRASSPAALEITIVGKPGN